MCPAPKALHIDYLIPAPVRLLSTVGLYFGLCSNNTAHLDPALPVKHNSTAFEVCQAYHSTKPQMYFFFFLLLSPRSHPSLLC